VTTIFLTSWPIWGDMVKVVNPNLTMTIPKEKYSRKRKIPDYFVVEISVNCDHFTMTIW
jgi:hypothetical protein